MEKKDAEAISDMWSSGNRIDAIKLLRRETSMGLPAAKTYLENGFSEELLTALCKDFVKDDLDLLVEAIREQRQLFDHIEKLVSKIQQERMT